jgi:hypothetical protein
MPGGILDLPSPNIVMNMNWSSPHRYRSSVLFSVLFLFAAGSIQAQSAADTIAFIIKNKKK